MRKIIFDDKSAKQLRKANKLKFAKKKKVSISKLKKKAWALCSQYIRIKYADRNGYDTCYTCGTRKMWKAMQAGHGIGGRNNAVLFMEEVIRPQCAGCNIWGRGKYSIFAEKLIGEYGAKKYAHLVFMSNKPNPLKVVDYEAFIDIYKRKLKELGV